MEQYTETNAVKLRHIRQLEIHISNADNSSLIFLNEFFLHHFAFN